MARRSHGTMPAAEAGGGQQGGAHILTRPSNRIRQSHALRHSRSNRARQRASRAMRMLRIDAPIFPAGDFTLRIEQRSEEHTSELQSLMRISYAVFCLKKKTTTKT